LNVKPVDAKCTIVKGDSESYCDRESRYTLLASVPVADQYYVHNDCQCNQLLACTNRVVCNWVDTNEHAMRRLKKLADRMGDYFGRRHPLGYEDWAAKFTGRKGQRYAYAQTSLESMPVSKKDAVISAFVKLERVLDPNKDPRMIQARGARYNIELGNYLKAMEHDLYELHGDGPLAKYLPSGRVIAKGLNQTERATLLRSKWDRMKQPVQLALDCSRFDGHCSVDLLKMEHRVYNRVFKDPYLAKLLSWQLHNTCFTKSGMKYKTIGRRMSGDMNTALGNCVLMILMIVDSMQMIGASPTQWDIIDDGDDCCLLVEKSIADVVKFSLPRLFRDYGHDLKIESVAEAINDVELCGCKPITVCGVEKFILRPQRCMGKTLTVVKEFNPEFLARYMSTIGQCQLALHHGVPVLQEFALLLRRAHPKLLRELPRSYQYRLANEADPWCAVPVEITDESREQFSLAFDISVEQQYEVEDHLRQMSGDQLLRLASPLEVPADKQVNVYVSK